MKDFKIRVINPEVSALIQRLLFRIGGKWAGVDNAVELTEKPFIFYYDDDKNITYSDSENYFLEHRNMEITFEQLVEEIEQELE